MSKKVIPSIKQNDSNRHIFKSVLAKNVSSEKKESQNILSMMEKLLYWAAIVESSDDAIMGISNEGVITSWNKGAERLYLYKSNEVIGKPVSILMPPDKENDFPFITKRLHEGKQIEHYETKRKSKDGRIIDVSITVSPIRDTNGNIIGASKIARDITSRIENERRREEFVSTTSHELKTPITSQKAYGELLERMIAKNGDSQYLSYIKKINAQTNKLTKLIEDLLELSRLQSGRLQLHRKEFYYDQLVMEIIEDVQLTVKHTIILESTPHLQVVGDRDRIGQVINNLLTNAAKYSQKADKIIVKVIKKNNFIVTSVQDFGIGIGKDYHQKIFERFFRVTGTDEKTYPGMGIGLNFSKEIITKHKGKVWVESEKGKGSTFYFSLPIKND